MDEFFPVKDVNRLVHTGLMDLQKAQSKISETSQAYLDALKTLQNLQVGKFQYKYKNKKTGKVETIDSHFFTDEEVQQALNLGHDLHNAAGTRKQL